MHAAAKGVEEGRDNVKEPRIKKTGAAAKTR